MIQFDLPKNQSSIIKVLGVGGGGSNAVNHMYSQNIDGVDFIICNTDAQAIAQSSVPNKIQLGPMLTAGLGAGANPEIGRQATEESLEEIKKILEVNTKMAFITAGMGGGTGTGGAPILAALCKKLGILTVGIVTTPFSYEGRKRIAQAQEGINQIKEHVDTLLVISNDKVRHQYGNLKVKEAFSKADNVLATAAKCITDVINSTGQINVDFADVCTVMKNGGVAILGSAIAQGENRAQEAIENALNSPLLNDNDIHGAKWILININSAEGEHEFTMDEVEVIQNHLISQSGENSDVILGLGYDNTLGDQISVTLIATGFDHKDPFAKKEEPVKEQKEDRVVMQLDMPDAPILKADVQEEPASVVNVVAEAKADPMMPTLVDPAMSPAPAQSAMQFVFDDPVAPMAAAPEEPIEVFTLDLDENKPSAVVVTPVVQQEEAPAPLNEESKVPGFLRKPEQIYQPEKPAEAPLQFRMINTPEAVREMNMELVEKSAQQPQQPEAAAQPVFQRPVENNFLHDEAELRKKAMDRIEKLRKISFTVNNSDPSNEYENVPAYLRRDQNVKETTHVENFYSNYTVNTDENNKVEISGFNSFLDGKKPD